ncbi:MAG: hypothetical protein EPN93_13360 [Spirochaetes bacterium]|nr:MAG: hypothetical protein EPN93_13360 [Spirochaetota bacterium]
MKNLLRILGIMKSHRVGLALGSGGAKGIAHIAVIEYLESLGIPVHFIAGSSIGAMVGAIYAAGGMGKFKQDLLKVSARELLGYFDPVFPRSGLIEGNRIKEYLSRYIPRGTTFQDLRIPLGITATDLAAGKPMVFQSGNVIDAIRASISIPGVFEPVCHGETILVDGGVANPLPIDIVKDMGATLVVAVNLHPFLKPGFLKSRLRASDYTPIDASGVRAAGKRPDLSAGLAEKARGWKWLQSVEKWLGEGKEKAGPCLPNIFEVLAQSLDIMELVNTRSMIAYNPPAVLIEPELMSLGMLDFTRARDTLERGTQAALKTEGALKRRIKAKL